jgi:hypothetical protein
MYGIHRPVSQSEVADLWALVAEARTEKDDHAGAVRALRAVEINRTPAPFDARQRVHEVRHP